MLWRTHLMAGSCAAAYTASVLGTEKIILAAAIGGFASLIPDIDSPNTKLGKLIPIVSWVVLIIGGHRGPFHSIMGAALLTAVFSLIAHSWYDTTFILHFLAPVFAVGYISHVILDCITPKGCPLFFPATRHFSLSLFQSGGFTEQLLISPAATFLTIWYLVKAIGWF